MQIRNLLCADGDKKVTTACRKIQLTIAGLTLFICSLAASASLLAQGPNFDWAKQMGGTDWDNGYSIAVDNYGSIYTTGLFRGTADFDPGADTFNLTSNGGNDIFVSKLDPMGGFVWARSFGSTKFEYAYAIDVDDEGSVYITGQFSDSVDFDPGPDVSYLYSNGSNDIYILKLDSAGDFVWAKSIGGGGVVDQGYALTVDADHNLYVTGSFVGTVDFDPGPDVFNLNPLNMAGNAFVLKLDAVGDFVWAKDMGQVANAYSSCFGYSIATDSMSNVYVTGGFKDTIDFDPGIDEYKLVGKGSQDIFIVKLDSIGDFVWAKSMGSVHPTRADVGLSIAMDPEQNVYVTGTFNETVDFDPGTDVFNLTADNAQDSDIFILKLNNDGEFVWAKSISGNTNSPFENNFSFSIKLDKAGNSYVSGYFWGIADFDPGTSLVSLTSTGASDIFILKLNPSGDFVWVKQFGGANIDVTRSSALDASGNIYTTGWFRDISDFDPGPGTALLTASNADIVIFKLSCGDTTTSSITDSADCAGYTLNDTTYMESGTYIQRLPNAQGCDSIITLNLTIIPSLNMEINITIDVHELGTVEHFATYQWMLNGAAIPGATDSTYTVTENGDYQVAVTNERGCADTSDIYTVTNANGIADMTEWAGKIKVYPNPSDDLVYIQAPIPVNVDITGIEGKHIMQIKDAHSFSIKSLSSGLYLLRITDKNGGLIQTVKLIRQ